MQALWFLKYERDVAIPKEENHGGTLHVSPAISLTDPCSNPVACLLAFGEMALTSVQAEDAASVSSEEQPLPQPSPWHGAHPNLEQQQLGTGFWPKPAPVGIRVDGRETAGWQVLQHLRYLGEGGTSEVHSAQLLGTHAAVKEPVWPSSKVTPEELAAARARLADEIQLLLGPLKRLQARSSIK